MKSTFFIVILFLLGNSYRLSAQSEGDYRSIASGSWSATSTWERFTSGVWVAAPSAPTSTDGVIDIRNGHTVTSVASTVADQIIIESGGTLSLNTSFNIVDGTGTDLSILSGATLNMATGATLGVTGSLDNSGTFNWSGGTMNFGNGTLNNSGSFNFTGNNAINNSSGTNAVNNLAGGTITKSIGSGTSYIQVPFDNAGIVNVNTGILRGASGASVYTNSGSINLSAGTQFSLLFVGSITFNPGSVITGTGTVQLVNTVVNMALETPTGITVQVGGNVTGTGSLKVDGTLNWSGPTIAVPTQVAAGGTLNMTGTSSKTLSAPFTLDGTTNWTGGPLVFNGGALTNNGTFNVNTGAAADIHASGGSNSIVNNGTFAKIDNAGTTLTVTSVPMTNNSTGSITGIGGITFTGAGGTLTNNGNIAPGIATGTLTMDPSAVSSGSTAQISIVDNTGAGTGNDLLTLTGSTDLTGSALTILDNPSAPIGTYTIMTTSSGTFSGTFGTVNKTSDYASPVISGNTVTIEKITALPVIWGAFTAVPADGKVLLTWTTLQESNTSHFLVERSVNGQQFDVIGKVTASGNTSLPTTYMFTDPSPVAGQINYYCLRQVDRDARSAYSEVRVVNPKGSVDSYVNIYPNPVKDVLHLDVAAESVQVVINDMSGKSIKTFQLQAGMHTVSVGDLSRGIYQVVTHVKGKVVASKLMTKF